MMKKILLSFAAAGALAAAAVPAAAQPWREDGRYDGYHQTYRDGRLTRDYLERLDWKVANAAREGRISWGEARDLRSELREVQPIAWRVRSGQANRWEAARLERVLTRAEQAVNGGSRYSYNRGYEGYGWRR